MHDLGIPNPLRLTGEQIELIHSASLEILSQTGMRFFEQEALELFKKAGISIMDGNLIYIPPKLVDWALSTAPKNISIFDRHGDKVMELGGYRCYYGGGSDCNYIYDIKTGIRRLAVLNDVEVGVRLADSLQNTDFIMSMFMPSDVAAQHHEFYQMAIMLRGSHKPVVFVGEKLDSTICAIEMATIIRGSLEALQHKPFIINYVNAKSPLQHNQVSVQRLLYSAERNLPTIYAPANSRGTTAPMTPAGALALGNAGQLAGLVLSQLKREGAPFLRSNPSGNVMDMRTMVSLYCAPDTGTLGWDLAHSYELPIFGIAGCSDAKVFDEQAATEAALSLVMNTIGGANLIHDIGYLDCAMTGSLELFVFCEEVIGWLKRYLRTPEINKETLAIDLIHQVGPDNLFLETNHTLRHVRDDWSPTLFDRFNFQRWTERGATTLKDRANMKVINLIEEHRPDSLPSNLQEGIDQVLHRHCEGAN